MKNINILIKPASSACNMSCSYCFYHDVATNRDTYFEGMLSLDTAENIIKKAFNYAKESCVFTFQGGEPTLRGIEFFKAFIDLVNKYNINKIKVFYSIQTNGTLIDEAFAKFFYENNFLVGVSLDGPPKSHDLNRTFHDKSPTFSDVYNAIELFNKYNVEYNVLAVVTGKNAQSIRRIYRFFKKNNFKWLQLIPCLEPLSSNRGKEDYYLSPYEYGNFLISLFDEWYEDFMSGNYISIRLFDNIIHMLLGYPPESCNMNGVCSIQFVIEGDGSVYPCDFYVLDEWKLGNINNDSLQDIYNNSKARDFVNTSSVLPDDCRSCKFLQLCRNGCRRDRVTDENKTLGKNYYCSAYKSFYNQRIEKLIECAKSVQRNYPQ